MTSDRESARASVLDALPRESLEADPTFDHVSEVVASICGAEMSNVSLMEDERQCLLGSVGIELDGWDRDISFCTHTLERGDVLIVEDATKDPRFRDNPLVRDEEFHLRFYAGIPLFLESTPFGTLCVLGSEPRSLDDAQRGALFNLARQVEQYVGILMRHDLSDDLKKTLSRLTSAVAETERLRHVELENSDPDMLDSLERCIEGASRLLDQHVQDDDDWLDDPLGSTESGERRGANDASFER
jgi:hypothetical protein